MDGTETGSRDCRCCCFCLFVAIEWASQWQLDWYVISWNTPPKKKKKSETERKATFKIDSMLDHAPLMWCTITHAFFFFGGGGEVFKIAINNGLTFWMWLAMTAWRTNRDTAAPVWRLPLLARWAFTTEYACSCFHTVYCVAVHCCVRV